MSALFLKHPRETDLALFAGGESGPFARWRIERHVEHCPECQEIAADFFRLPDQLNELADLPSVDWKHMAMAIESGVRADAAAGRPARRSGSLPPLAWQTGLVAATVVVGVVVVQYAGQLKPEPEAVAVARVEAPAPQVEQRREIVEAESATAEVATATQQSKAVEKRQTFASDVAAPAAPPPPPPAAANEAVVFRQASGTAQPVAAEAESAEARLRKDAAARVGAVSALAVSDDTGGGPLQRRVDWVQNPVGAVNFEDAPLSLLSGYALVAGEVAQTPNVVVSNRSSRTIVGFELVWIAGDGVGRATTQVEHRDLAMDPGAVTTTGGGQQWRLPSGGFSTMRVYPSAATFDDGTTWLPTAAQIAEKGLTSPAGVQQLQLLDPTF